MNRRVVISGLGAISCAGANMDEFRRNITAGICCLSPWVNPRDPHLQGRYAGLVRGHQAALEEAAAQLKSFDRHVHLAVVAVREALADANLHPADFGRRLGLVFATCSGPMLLIEDHYERIVRGEPGLTEEQLFAKRYYAGARVLAHQFGLEGLVITVVTACSASTGALALATDLIRCGLIDAALAGGADAFSSSTLAGFEGLKATSNGKCAPFSKPPGLNLGEAGGFVVVEALESAQRRQADIHAEILGSGMSNDAYHCSAPDPGGRGLAMAMSRALKNAGLVPPQIGYLNAHGTGTEANDKAETKAIRKVFGDQAQLLPVSSTKSMVGHCLGAAGIIEVIASIVCAQDGVLPSTANFTGPREGCTLDYVPVPKRPWLGPRWFLSNNAAFGGHNASVAIAVPRGPAPEAMMPAGQEAIGIMACGLVTPAGLGARALAEAWQQNRTCVVTRTIPGLPALSAGLVNAEQTAGFDRRLDLRDMGRSSRWATVAAKLALREAQYPEQSSKLSELGLFLSLSAGPSEAETEFLTSYLQNQRRVENILAFPFIVPSSVAGEVCRTLRLTGHNLTLSAGPGAGLIGLAPAFSALRAGHLGAALCGAVDELTDRILTDHYLAGLLNDSTREPPGEGAAWLVLETASQARQRGATPLAWISGLAFATDVAQARLPNASVQSITEVVHAALAQAKAGIDELQSICLHGPRPRLAQALEEIIPDWREKLVDVSPITGCLEGAQPLLDLSVALLTPAQELVRLIGKRSGKPGFAPGLKSTDGSRTPRDGLPATGPTPPPARPFVLALSSSPSGVHCAVVFRKN